MDNRESIKASYVVASEIRRIEECLYREELVQASTGVAQDSVRYYREKLNALVHEWESLTGREW